MEAITMVLNDFLASVGRGVHAAGLHLALGATACGGDLAIEGGGNRGNDGKVYTCESGYLMFTQKCPEDWVRESRRDDVLSDCGNYQRQGKNVNVCVELACTSGRTQQEMDTAVENCSRTYFGRKG